MLHCLWDQGNLSEDFLLGHVLDENWYFAMHVQYYCIWSTVKMHGVLENVGIGLLFKQKNNN